MFVLRIDARYLHSVLGFREVERRNTDAANLLRLWTFLDNKQLGHGLLVAAKRGPAD